MIKKLLCMITLFFVTINLYSAQNLSIFENVSSYSRADLANIEDDFNPANLGFRNEKSSIFKTYILFRDDYELNYNASYLHSPKSTISATFYGQNLSLTFKAENYLVNRTVNTSSIDYVGRIRYLLQLDWGFEYKDVSIGMRLKGGSELERGNFSLRTNYLAIPDYIVNTFFSRYVTRTDSQFFNFGFGLIYRPLDNLSFSLTTDSNFSSTGGIDNYNIFYYLKDISIGFSYITDKYSKQDELNLFRYKLSSSFLNMGDNDYREVNLSNEFMFQISRDFVVSFMFGMYEQKPSIINLFSVDSHKANTTYGLSLDWKNYDLNISTNIPFSFYSGSANSDDKIGLDIKFIYSF